MGGAMNLCFRQALAVVACLGLTGALGAQPPVLSITSVEQLKRMSRPELEMVFASGTATSQPVGFLRGYVLDLSDDYRFQRMGIGLSRLAWKGKHFAQDGSFINQFTGFKALSSHAV